MTLKGVKIKTTLFVYGQLLHSLPFLKIWLQVAYFQHLCKIIIFGTGGNSYFCSYFSIWTTEIRKCLPKCPFTATTPLHWFEKEKEEQPFIQINLQGKKEVQNVRKIAKNDIIRAITFTTVHNIPLFNLINF